VRVSALRAGGWCAIGALVVLGARALAYALAPQRSVLSLRLEHAAGGPRLVTVAAAALGIAIVTAAAVVGVAAVAVRERMELSTDLVVSPPRLRPLRLAGRFAGLFVVTSLAFALLESYLHWRAGLGWHGIHCLIGPVHRDAIPLLVALSLVAVAFVEAMSHVFCWARRTIAHFLARPRARRARSPVRRLPRSVELAPLWLAAPLPARGPPG
jgi:hypothetical protein